MAGLCEVCADSVTKSVCRSVCRSVRVCQPLIGNSRGISKVCLPAVLYHRPLLIPPLPSLVVLN